MAKAFRTCAFCLLPFALAGCRTVGPAYEKPSAPVAAAWNVPAPWRPGDPKDTLPKGTWWTTFQDDGLDAIEAAATSANQSIEAATARFEQARALTRIAFSTLYPQVSTSPLIEEQRQAANRPGATTALTGANIVLPFTVSYEVDLFGKRRRTIEEAQASLQSSAAQLENVRLVIAAEVAGDYFALAQVDAELAILDRTVQNLQRGYDLVKARHDGGIASGLDLAQAATLLESTRTQLTLERRQRDEIEHGLAVLAGRPAPDFHVTPRPLGAEPPPLALGLPSDLLERRPDIAAAERQMAVANAQIGVAMSAYFPSLNLFGTGGWQSVAIGSLFSAGSTLWAVGASAVESIFTGGATRARVDFARADYRETIATYRGVVLNALREVQDGVDGLAVLGDAQASQTRAVDAAGQAAAIALNRYQGGLASYLEVVTAQQTLLANERLGVQIRGERLIAAVGLVKALGGGWDASSLSALTAKGK